VGVKSPSLLAFSVIPALDIVSDLQYIIVTAFHSQLFFYPCVICVVLPASFFVWRLVSMHALLPHFLFPLPEFLEDGTLLWLGYRKGFPLYRGEKMRTLSFERHDTLNKLACFWLLWAACIAVQSLCLVVYVGLFAPLIALHFPFWCLWFLLGCYLFQIKMMSVGQVWTLWFRVWRCKDGGRLDSRALVDTEVMNEALFAAFVLETIPHLILQAANNQYLEKWSSVAYFSTSLSVFNCLNGLYRFLYFTRFLGVKFEDIPLEISIGTLTLKLDKATHLQGVEFKKDYRKLARSEVEMMFLDKDTRFVEVRSLLRSAEPFRNQDVHGGGRVFILPLPKSTRRRSILSRLSVSVHLGRNKIHVEDARDAWLAILGTVVLEWENDQTPALSDLIVNTIMHAFKKQGITSEQELHDALRSRLDESSRSAYVRDYLQLTGLLYHSILLSYFERVWVFLENKSWGYSFKDVERGVDWLKQKDPGQSGQSEKSTRESEKTTPSGKRLRIRRGMDKVGPLPMQPLSIAAGGALVLQPLPEEASLAKPTDLPRPVQQLAPTDPPSPSEELDQKSISRQLTVSPSPSEELEELRQPMQAAMLTIASHEDDGSFDDYEEPNDYYLDSDDEDGGLSSRRGPSRRSSRSSKRVTRKRIVYI
jgi:hypothetical protein